MTPDTDDTRRLTNKRVVTFLNQPLEDSVVDGPEFEIKSHCLNVNYCVANLPMPPTAPVACSHVCPFVTHSVPTLILGLQ